MLLIINSYHSEKIFRAIFSYRVSTSDCCVSYSGKFLTERAFLYDFPGLILLFRWNVVCDRAGDVFQHTESKLPVLRGYRCILFHIYWNHASRLFRNAFTELGSLTDIQRLLVPASNTYQ